MTEELAVFHVGSSGCGCENRDPHFHCSKCHARTGLMGHFSVEKGRIQCPPQEKI